jgi:hypothetical protein
MNNILDKKCKALAPTFGNTEASVPKREKFQWSEPCDPGVFMLLDKYDLNIDGSYQRDEVSRAKVVEIAREWDWKLFGVISVIRRSDGSFWVYDGGHRCRASFFRDDITRLPCMVFEADDERTEAKAFIGANTMKSAVSAYHKHRAAVKTHEPLALAVQSIIEKHSYFPTQSASKKYGFSAVNTLRSMVLDDAALADAAFGVCAAIAQDGEPISGEVIEALFVCQKKIGDRVSILSGEYLERLKLETLRGIEAVIRREKHIAGRGGAAISAKAVLDLLNKGRRRRLAFQ